MLSSSTSGGGNECIKSGACDGVNGAAEELGRLGGESSGRTTGGEGGLSGGASGKFDGEILPSVWGTLGKYPPPLDMVRSAVNASNGDTCGGAVL